MDLARPLVSICIPAYKRPEKLSRLLASIAMQTFRDFEVVVSDDSPDDSVKKALLEFNLPMRYFKNEEALGTPANWNFAISKANGEWIKIMHDDDWFSEAGSLETFMNYADNNDFIFSHYTNVNELGDKEEKRFPARWLQILKEEPGNLLAKNVIGPPSVMLIRRDVSHAYDTFMKWRVDIDFYIRLLRTGKTFKVVPQSLVNVGVSKSQVTNDCINVPSVELPEGLLLLKKYGSEPLKRIRVYDAWWRILRNVKVRSKEDLYEHTPYDSWPEIIVKIVRHQSLLPYSLLKLGVVSKFFMTISYLLNYKSI